MSDNPFGFGAGHGLAASPSTWPRRSRRSARCCRGRAARSTGTSPATARRAAVAGSRPVAVPATAPGRAGPAPGRPVARRGDRAAPAGGRAEAWSRAEWVERTLPVWQALVEPVAERVVAAMGSAMERRDAEGSEGSRSCRRSVCPPSTAASSAGMIRVDERVDVRRPGRARRSAPSPARSSAPPTSALPLGPRRAGRAAARQRRRVRRGPRACPTTRCALYLALREAAHQRLFAHVAVAAGPHLLGAVDAYARGIQIDAERHRDGHERARPDRPGRDAGGAGRRPVRAAHHARPSRRRSPGSRRCSPWSRAGSTRSSAAAAEPHAARRRAARDRTPPPRDRRPGRADLRHAGRPRAAAAAAARRRRAVGGAAPRRAAPRAATPSGRHPDLLPTRRRPRRPARRSRAGPAGATTSRPARDRCCADRARPARPTSGRHA